MIKRELLMHAIACNVVRHVIQSASIRNHKALARISFKGSLDTLRYWAPILDADRKKPRKSMGHVPRRNRPSKNPRNHPKPALS